MKTWRNGIQSTIRKNFCCYTERKAFPSKLVWAHSKNLQFISPECWRIKNFATDSKMPAQLFKYRLNETFHERRKPSCDWKTHLWLKLHSYFSKSMHSFFFFSCRQRVMAFTKCLNFLYIRNTDIQLTFQIFALKR